MTVLASWGAWALRGLSAIGLYNIVDAVSDEQIGPPTEERMALIGLGGAVFGYFLYMYLDKPKTRYKR